MTFETIANGRNVASEIPVTPTAPVVVAIPVRKGPIGDIATSADGKRLVVTNCADDSVSVIDTETRRVIETVNGVSEPSAIVLAGNLAYVSTVTTSYDSVEVLDVSTGTVVGAHPLALNVSDVAVSPDAKWVYAGRNGVHGADLAVLDTTTDRVEVIDIAGASGTTIECVRASADGTLFLGINGPVGGRVVAIETGARRGRADKARSWRRKPQSGPHVVGAVEIGSAVRDVAISPDGGTAYVASCGVDFGAVVDVIDTRTSTITSTRKISEIGGLVTRLSLSGDGDRAYLISEDRVTVLSAATQDVVATIRVDQPSCAVESADGQRLYIADYAGSITVAALEGIALEADLDVADAALESADSVDWHLRDLLQRERALA